VLEGGCRNLAEAIPRQPEKRGILVVLDDRDNSLRRRRFGINFSILGFVLALGPSTIGSVNEKAQEALLPSAPKAFIDAANQGTWSVIQM
jgi:hypothetical protein